MTQLEFHRGPSASNSQQVATLLNAQVNSASADYRNCVVAYEQIAAVAGYVC